MDDYNENNINNINQSPEYFDKKQSERQGYNKPEYSFWAERHRDIRIPYPSSAGK